MSSPRLFRANRAMAGLTFRHASHSASDSSAVHRVAQIPHAGTLEHFGHHHDLALHQIGVAVHRDQQQRLDVGRQSKMFEVLDGPGGALIPPSGFFSVTGHRCRPAIFANRHASIRQPGECGQGGQLGCGPGDQPHRDLGGNAQRALRPDEEPLEISPRPRP